VEEKEEKTNVLYPETNKKSKQIYPLLYTILIIFPIMEQHWYEVWTKVQSKRQQIRKNVSNKNNLIPRQMSRMKFFQLHIWSPILSLRSFSLDGIWYKVLGYLHIRATCKVTRWGAEKGQFQHQTCKLGLKILQNKIIATQTSGGKLVSINFGDKLSFILSFLSYALNPFSYKP
jgi:hypothetical protein